MEGSPVIFKRTKSKTATRPRVSSPLSTHVGGEDVEEDVSASPSILAAKLKNKQKARSKPKSRLSFGGDDEGEEGDVFQVKKSNLSRKLALGTHPASPKVALPTTLDQASISPRSNGAPTYSKAYLSELKASTPTSRPPPPDNMSFDDDMSFSASEIAGAMVENVFADSETFIPANSSIIAAKQKRERLRTTVSNASDDDFISLTVSTRDDVPQGPHPESRLVREEDEIGEGEDEFAEYTSAQERIALGKKARKKEAGARRDAMKELIEDAEEEDDETMEWEQEQLRRVNQGTEIFLHSPVKEVYKPAPIPPPTNIPVLASAVSRLSQSLTSLTISHANNTASMNSLSSEREHLLSKEAEIREMVTKAEAKRSWFVGFRENIEGVATFLDEKFSLVEKLEDEHISLLKERYEIVLQRRYNEDQDDATLFLGALPELEKPEEEVLDELGRIIPRKNPDAIRRDRRAARIARRSRRAARRSQPEEAEEGYSTDSSLPPSDDADFATAISKLSAKVNGVLSDVRSDEFQDPSLGVGRWFGDWRERFAESYTGAWGGLGLVGAWEFWVRLEVVGWNPMTDPRGLDSFAWYSGLYEYSRPRGDEADNDVDPELGPDGDLVSAMISTAIVPRLCKLVEGGAFDPYSNIHIRRVVDLAEQVEASVERDNLKFQMLVKSVLQPIRDAITSTVSLVSQYMQLHNARFDPEAIPARRRFLARRIKLLKNLLVWRKYMGEKFGSGELATRLVQECILPVAESGWEVGGEELMQKVVKILPKELEPPGLMSRLRIP